MKRRRRKIHAGYRGFELVRRKDGIGIVAYGIRGERKLMEVVPKEGQFGLDRAKRVVDAMRGD